MYTLNNKKQDNKNRTPKKKEPSPTSQLKNNRQEGISQQNQQKHIDNSTQVKKIAQLQQSVNNSTANKQRSIQKKPNNTGLPDNLKSGVENLSGHTMDDVKVHYNSDKPTQLNAHAYAQGTDIHIASGQEKHLAHEAWHVVQQKQGRVKPTMQMKGKININDDLGLEREADIMGAKASLYAEETNKKTPIEIPLHYKNETTINKKTSQKTIQKQSKESKIVVQRVIKIADTDYSGTPEDVYDIIKGGRDARKAIDKWGSEGLLQWLKEHDNQTFTNTNAIQSEIKKAMKNWVPNAVDKKSKSSFINIARSKVGSCIDTILGDSRPANEIYYKISLVSELENSSTYLNHFIDRMKKIATAIEEKQPLDIPGIKATLKLLTSTWPKEPADYLKDGSDHLSLVGKNNDGIPLSIKGLNSELDAILNVSKEELAEGEVVFSGSNYTDPKKTEMTKDVDVSYIDNNNVLHLIENGKDMNTLKNKVVGSHDQKKIYNHLTKKTNEITHTAVGNLTPTQSQRSEISKIMWWYSVPPETLDLDISKEDIKSILESLVSTGAGIRSGDKRFEVEDLKVILSSQAK